MLVPIIYLMQRKPRKQEETVTDKNALGPIINDQLQALPLTEAKGLIVFFFFFAWFTVGQPLFIYLFELYSLYTPHAPFISTLFPFRRRKV